MVDAGPRNPPLPEAGSCLDQDPNDELTNAIPSARNIADEARPPSEDTDGDDSPSADCKALPNRTERRIFGMKRNVKAAAPHFYATDDYGKKYPPDLIYEEMGPNARAWRMYLDECTIFDGDMSEANRDTLDVLLVFAGLFSISSSILYELLVVQRAIGNGSAISLAPLAPSPSADFTPSTAITWVNGLWYASLTLSLITALVAVLAKQSLIRQYRYDGFERWHVEAIIAMLPVTLHTAVSLLVA
ncbi:hypothetical protein DFH08DRAFT_978721 [Mycena albidolilacea]|uniref:DUF6535 domain-containing protein n=1 Tax=Mycena albidolilacea TaxID=1033008 RepID=A0AAD6YY06_9AGAR|nr:hypothetical protein DFH08DRAFT_978721 [Mycena albidolilacea]